MTAIEMSKPEVVVFDLGKVLVDFDYSLVANRLKARSTADIGAVAARLDQSTLLVEYETGRISTDQFFAQIRKLTGYDGTLEEFAVAFGDIFSPIEEMIEWQATLKSRGVPTFIFSNTNELAVRHITGAFPFFGGFDAYVYSHEVGSMKPDAKIYEAVEAATNRSGKQILYIDDKIENFEGGRSRGWHTIHHVTPGETLAQAAVHGF
jgi:HAD superfamily hydrolase (TIGR01509 family)